MCCPSGSRTPLFPDGLAAFLFGGYLRRKKRQDSVTRQANPLFLLIYSKLGLFGTRANVEVR